MKTIIILLLLSTPVQADYWYAEIGAGFNDWGNVEQWDRNDKIGALFTAGRVWEVNPGNDLILELGHLSHWNEGPPINDNSEPFVHYVHVKYRFKWY